MLRSLVETLELRTLLDATVSNGLLTVTGTDNAETISVNPQGAQIIVDIGGAQTPFAAADVAQIHIDARGGNDVVNVNVNRPATILGGAGNDVLNGGAGNELLDGGDGNDRIDGNGGADTSLMGAGNDTFVWDPGDGSDIVNGQDGFDTMLFNGSNGNETFDASANGSRLRFFRNLGNIVMDVGTTEKLDVRALGGDDATTIHDLSGTGVTNIFVDGGDGNDSFVGSALPETFLGGAGNDTAVFGDGDFLDMGAGTDELSFFASPDNDNIHLDAKPLGGSDTQVIFHGNVGLHSAVFDNGEIVTIHTVGGNDKVTVHKRADELWTVNAEV
jgi:Ca2+-binding RTX toxin-like protein